MHVHVHALRCKSFGAGSVKGLIRIEAATVETRLTETESFTGALGSFFDQDKQGGNAHADQMEQDRPPEFSKRTNVMFTASTAKCRSK